MAWSGGGKTGLENSPEHALMLGVFIAAYADLEHTLTLSLSALCGAPEFMTWRILSVVRNTSTKADIVQSLVEFLKHEEAKEEFNNFIAEFRSISKMRNRLMHMPYVKDDKSGTVHQIDHGKIGQKVGHVLTESDIADLTRRCRDRSAQHINWVIKSSHAGLLELVAK